MWTVKKSSVFGLLAFGLTGLAAQASAQDLWTIYQLALDNDPEFQAQQLDHAASLEAVPQARAGLKPNIGLDAGRTRRRQEIESNGVGVTERGFISQGEATFDIDSLSLNLSQAIYDRGKRLGLKQAKANVAGADATLLAAEQDLRLRVAERYFAVLAAQDNFGVAQSEKKAIGRQLELADERLQVGLGTKTDLFDAQARYQSAEAGEIEAETLIDDARQALAEVIGQSVAELATLGEDSPLDPPVPADVAEWIGSALAQNPILRQLQNATRSAELEIDRRRAVRRPVVNLNLSQVYNDSDGSVSGPGSDTDTRDIALQLAVPLYQGGLIGSRVAEADAQYQASVRRLEAQKRSVDRQVRAAYLDVTSSIKRVNAFAQSVKASESAVQAKEEGFAAGLNTNVDVLDAQRDLFASLRDYLQSRYDYILNLLRLERAVGTLDEADLEKVNSWLITNHQ